MLSVHSEVYGIACVPFLEAEGKNGNVQMEEKRHETKKTIWAILMQRRSERHFCTNVDFLRNIKPLLGV